jgi:membrane fusion protein
MTKRPLFRSESQEARANAWLGRVILTRPLSFTFLVGAAIAFAIGLAVFFTFGEYTRKARVTGVLAPASGVVRIIAQQSGVVEALHAAEGREVRRDAPLLVLGDARAAAGDREAGAAVAQRIHERGAALAKQRERTIAAMEAEQASMLERTARLEREIGQVDLEIAQQRSRHELALHGVGRAQGLETVGFLSQAAVDRERDAAFEQSSRLQSLRRSRMALEREQAAALQDSRLARSRAQVQLAALDAQAAATEQEQVERGLQYRATIVAPADGTVATVLVERGQMVTAGTPLLAIIPAGSTLEAHLYAPSRSIGFMHAGQPVLLRYLAYPHQKFGMHRANVIAVSRNPMPPNELGFTPLDGSREPLYRIKAQLDAQSIAAYGRLEALQPGMQVEADILLDRRRLIEWIFEPLLGLAGRT